jgi:hypothetical protein
VNAASGALTSVGTSLQGATSVDDLKSRSGELEEQIAGFEQAIASMSGYTIAIPALERQRAALVEEGDDVTKALRGFAEATQSGDADTIQAQVPAIAEAVTAFGTAAQEAAQG